ncbi:LysE family translocator [Arcobacter sp. LA11]|uniref:LysE family translocator n=1 Tax=Arcobacter sp. LA11 TaxID=1898176 RepID=UPI0009F98B1B|nr:LysE family translocator [Arcobacter sp. LA11]
MINDYLAYIILAITVTAVPGPAVILTIKNSLQYGYKVSMANIFGNFLAMIILASISAIGLGAIILASETIFYAMKILGCIYLVYLGIKVWTSPYKNEERTTKIAEKGLITIFKEGFFVGISNPKAIVFFVALFPQFIDPTREYFLQFTTLILTIEGISFFVLLIYALLAFKFAKYLTKEKTIKQFNKITGGIFIGFGVALLYKN